ncbi:MAG: n-acetylglutamate synthase [Bacteroidota bacterium]
MEKRLPGWSYHGRAFRSVSNSSSGEVSNETTFFYKQKGHIISAKYEGGGIAKGNLLGTVEADGTIQMSYQHWNVDNEFRAGVCTSKPEILPNGKIRLYETWEWTDGIEGCGQSIIEEI